MVIVLVLIAVIAIDLHPQLMQQARQPLSQQLPQEQSIPIRIGLSSSIGDNHSGWIVAPLHLDTILSPVAVLTINEGIDIAHEAMISGLMSRCTLQQAATARATSSEKLLGRKNRERVKSRPHRFAELLISHGDHRRE